MRPSRANCGPGAIDQMPTNVVKKVRLGDEVIAYCGKCREERNHQIASLAAGAIERVTCLYCRGTHLYKEKKVKTTGEKRVSRKKRQKEESPGEDAPVRTYSTSETFSKGEVLSHPTFGSGKVIEVRSGKIDVKFGSDTRTLLHRG